MYDSFYDERSQEEIDAEEKRKAEEYKRLLERSRIQKLEKQRQEKVERETREREQRERVEREERDRVEMLDREIDEFEFKEYPKPERSVTVLVKMHGMNTEDRLPDFPENTVIGTKVCLASTTTSLQYTNTLKEIYKHKLSDANQRYERPVPTDAMLEKNKKLLMSFNHNKVPEEELLSLYKEKVEGRRYIYDREYTLEDDTDGMAMGITLIHTNVPELKPLEIPTDFEMTLESVHPEKYKFFLEHQ
jgi:hypothetical protein